MLSMGFVLICAHPYRFKYYMMGVQAVCLA